ncbi:MAG TPA: efflux RND transporter periplasmic adaptor subunit [Vicinamibacterales bacterium]|jgi:RND family efflux transporter MFP subunit|nr:efflux RND transporter periplasmic adaptor subunit [Vicinamibacterales bacterium]
MTRMICILHAFIASAGLLGGAACGTEARAKTERDSSTRGRPAVAVTIAPATASDVIETVDAVGSLAPKFVADVKSEVSGTVTAVYVTEWVAVRRGAPLARLDATETDAAIEALKAIEAQTRVVESRARREHERALQLQKYGLITPQALDEARSALEAAEAGCAAARAQIRTGEARLAKSFINAPMDGIVAARRISVGDRVENMGGGEPMFRIVDNRVLDLTMAVPASQLAAIRVGQPIEFATDALPGRTFTGRVMFINPAIDEASRSVKVIAAVPNGDGLLKGGLFVQGRIVVGRRQNVLRVPREALVNWNAAARTADVFVVWAGAAERRPVKTGSVGENGIEITAGLDRGDRVVVRGAFALRPGDRVTLGSADEGA